MANYEPILNALQNDLLVIMMLCMILGVLHLVPSMVVAFVAAARTERTLWAELPRGSFWGWVLGVPIWVAVLVLLIGLAEMLLGSRIEKFRDNLIIGFAVIGFLAAVSVQYLLVVHYFRSLIQDRLGWRLDEPRFQPPQRYFTFSLRKLLLAQVGLIFLFGLWVGARREGILKDYAVRAEKAQRALRAESLSKRFGAPGWGYSTHDQKGLWLSAASLVNLNDDALLLITPADRLYRIDIRSDGLTDQGVAILSQLTELQEISLESANVTDAGIAHLKQLKRLRTLHLECRQLTERVLEELQAMEALEKITLDRRNLSPRRIEEFKRRNPSKQLVTYGTSVFQE